jgi:co-chaperonin GroES (HSP10)
MREQAQNERDWHKVRSDKTDRTTPNKSDAWKLSQWIAEAHPQRTGGTALAQYGGALKPLPHRLFVRRRAPDAFAAAKAVGIVIPDIADRHRGQQSTAIYDVLATGDGVVSVKQGDAIVASSYIGADLGDKLGEDCFLLWCDVPYVQGTAGDSDVVRRSCGDVLAIVEEE